MSIGDPGLDPEGIVSNANAKLGGIGLICGFSGAIAWAYLKSTPEFAFLAGLGPLGDILSLASCGTIGSYVTHRFSTKERYRRALLTLLDDLEDLHNNIAQLSFETYTFQIKSLTKRYEKILKRYRKDPEDLQLTIKSEGSAFYARNLNLIEEAVQILRKAMAPPTQQPAIGTGQMHHQQNTIAPPPVATLPSTPSNQNPTTHQQVR